MSCRSEIPSTSNIECCCLLRFIKPLLVLQDSTLHVMLRLVASPPSPVLCSCHAQMSGGTGLSSHYCLTKNTPNWRQCVSPGGMSLHVFVVRVIVATVAPVANISVVQKPGVGGSGVGPRYAISS
jgi:hypothetical protein